MAISRNPMFYTVGIPQLFFYPVENWDDPQIVDWVALARAYSGLTEPTGQVLNANAIATCLEPGQILEKAYVGNLTSAEIGGEIKSVEHTASVMGRKEIDKLVVTRRSMEYTLGFDEMNVTNMRNFFAGDQVDFPTKDPVVAKTSAKAPQSAAADFVVGPVEIVDNGISTLGNDLSALEMILTEKLMDQNANFTPVDVAGTDYYPAGVYYFIVADYQRNSVVDTALKAYRNKIVCAFFKYDPAEGMMKAQAFPASMGTVDYAYNDTTIDTRIKQLVTDSAANVGIPTNDAIDDRTVMDVYSDTQQWVINATSAVTRTLAVNIPGHIVRQATRIILQGQKWDGSAWIEHTEVLYDASMDSGATDDRTPLRSPDNGQYYVDAAQSYVDHVTGELKLVAHTDFAGTAGDMDAQGLTEQTMHVQIETYSAASNVLLWSGIVWAKKTDTYGTIRVNRGKPELEGCAVITFLNNVGVSYVQCIPKVVFRPDGTVDFSKEDWLQGGFILSALKDDDAYIPDLPSRLRIPFGFFSTFRVIEQV